MGDFKVTYNKNNGIFSLFDKNSENSYLFREHKNDLKTQCNDLISIIVPVYNADEYLEKCLDSLINQTYSNLEIILVNDGSSDNSLKIMKNYAEKDTRIKIINQINKGVSETRNEGLKHIKGKYVAFCDADDCYDLDGIEMMLSCYLKNNVDLVIGSIRSRKINSDIASTTLISKPGFHFVKNASTYEMLEKSHLLQSVCAKLYKADTLKAKFENWPFEDKMFNLDILGSIEKVFIMSDCVYTYYQYGRDVGRFNNILKTRKDTFNKMVEESQRRVSKRYYGNKRCIFFASMALLWSIGYDYNDLKLLNANNEQLNTCVKDGLSDNLLQTTVSNFIPENDQEKEIKEIILNKDSQSYIDKCIYNGLAQIQAENIFVNIVNKEISRNVIGLPEPPLRPPTPYPG